MKISIISGSHRDPSQSEKVASYIEKLIPEQFDSIEAQLYSLANNPLPLWDQSIWEDSPEWQERLADLKQQLSESDGFIFVVPEWHGMVPSGFKNFLLLFNRFQLGHKPALIISISAGTGGTYPVTELRMNSAKNNRLCYLPEHLIIRDVEKVFNANDEDNDQRSDGYYKERLNWTLDILISYAKALKQVRETTQVHHDKFANGM